MPQYAISEEILKWNDGFIDALENVDNVIKNASLEQPRLFVNRIQRGTAPLGQGLERDFWKFHSGAIDQAGLLDWRLVSRGTPASEGEAGQDVCADYPATLVRAGFEKTTYYAYETFRRSEDLCLNNIKWNWEFEQQVELYFGWLAEVTMRVCDNLGREGFMKLGSKYVLTSSADPEAVSVTYDPFTSKNATCAGGTTPVEITGAKLARMLIQLQLERPQSAITQISGMGSWGLVIDPEDFDTLILRETNTREELLYGSPNVMIDGLGTMKTWKGWTLMYNSLLPRFTYNAGTFTRVEPYSETATTKGYKQTLNKSYLDATHAACFVFPKDPIQMLIPPTGPGKIGKLSFGTQPGLNGDFFFLNIQDEVKNPLKEKGHFFGRYQTFLKPGMDVSQAKMFIYKR